MRRLYRIARDARIWRPSNASLLYSNLAFRARNEANGLRDGDHLAAAAQWLATAQDATRDGGVAGRYRLDTGWTSSYPETTGYIIPTFLTLESEAGFDGFRGRAGQCVEFLLGVQLPSGAFPGLEIAENREQPSIFNTAQILNGLTAWHRATGDEKVLTAARRAADWLVSSQDHDGAWRVHLYGGERTYTYMAHAACWLAELGEHLADARYLESARRHLEWVLGHVDPVTGWIDDCGFGEADQRARQAVTHTIAYTIWGVLLISRILRDDRGLEAARRAAHAVARRLELSRWLPGKLNAQWRPAAKYACLTGNAQMALVWFELHRLDGDPALVSSACKALDLVKRAQPMTTKDSNVRGGIPGSDPVWGDYISLALPNWAAKFFIDALLAKARTLRSLGSLPVHAGRLPMRVPSDVPLELPRGSAARTSRPTLALLTSRESAKVEQFCDAWKSWGFRPDLVVIRTSARTSPLVRLGKYVQDQGVVRLAKRAVGWSGGSTSAAPLRAQEDGHPPPRTAEAYCAANGIPTLLVESLDSPSVLAGLRAMKFDVFVYAGSGILRRDLLALPRLGTLNAHMGLLPPMRGMNVTEWSALCGVPVGCTVHLIDEGIDTGEILIFRPVDAVGARSSQELRERVDVAQVALLGEVARWIMEHGELPPRRAQMADEGRQFFSMHPDVRAALDDALRRGKIAFPAHGE